jgi:hypothetical protein
MEGAPVSGDHHYHRCNPKHIDTGELVCAATGELIDPIASTDEARRSFRRIRRGNPELGDIILVWRTVYEDDDPAHDHDESFLCRVRPVFTTSLADFRLGIAVRLRWERRDGWRHSDWRKPPWKPGT